MQDTAIDIISWKNDTPNEMGDFVAKQIKTVKRVDILTGYFFFHGFKAIREALDQNPELELRILVGMDAGVDTRGLVHEVYNYEETCAPENFPQHYLEQLEFRKT